LIEAFYQMANDKRFQGKLDLVFAGRPDPKFPYLITKVKELGLQGAVKFTGFVEDDDLPALYNNAELFAFPSLSEGFGIPGLEAQACGIPLAASNRTCFTEIFGGGAVYFDPENVSDMALKMSKILDDKGERARLVEKGFQNAAKFKWEDVALRTLEVYREIVYK
jgi:glycosyltransferase involved in cell wall biosynthesis